MVRITEENKVIEALHRAGHLQNPFGLENPEYDIPESLRNLSPLQSDYDQKIEGAIQRAKLRLTDRAVIEAVRSYQNFDANFEIAAQAAHHRPLIADGDCGPATEFVLNLPRCGHPDYLPPSELQPAYGSGNWRGCHDVGEFHSVSVRVTNSPPSFLAPHFETVKQRVTEAYAETGLLIRWDAPAPVNIDFEFVSRSTGWIGLAIVGQNQTCNSKIWCRYLSTYRGGSTDEAIITQWTTLIKHELGHNCGRGHTSGGVMNPSIVNGLPISWRGDVSWSWLVSQFGGVPVPIGGPKDRELWLGYWNGSKFDPLQKIPTGGGGGPMPGLN